MNGYLSLFTQTCVNAQEKKHNAYNKICLGNSLNVCICLTCSSLIKPLDPKIVLLQRCQNLRLLNKTPPDSIIATWSRHVVGSRRAPY